MQFHHCVMILPLLGSNPMYTTTYNGTLLTHQSFQPATHGLVEICRRRKRVFLNLISEFTLPDSSQIRTDTPLVPTGYTYIPGDLSTRWLWIGYNDGGEWLAWEGNTILWYEDTDSDPIPLHYEKIDTGTN